MRKNARNTGESITTERPVISAAYSTTEGFIEVVVSAFPNEIYVLLDALLLNVIPKLSDGGKLKLSYAEKFMLQQMIDIRRKKSRMNDADLLELIKCRLEGDNQ